MKLAALAVALGALGLSAAAAIPPGILHGLYRLHHVITVYNGPDDGVERLPVDDVLEIVPVDRGHAYMRVSLLFDNGHTCTAAGVVDREDGALVYRDADTAAPGQACTLILRRDGKRVVFEDVDRKCMRTYCGMRGTLNGTGFAVSSRRPIRDMKRLLSSREYRESMAAWRAQVRH